jgi:5-methylcytosine-specific restriction endonuclease McrA
MASRSSLDTYRWQKIRARVKARDGRACVVCGSTYRLSVHHILKARFGGTDDLSNLVTLCSHHHALADRGRKRRGLQAALQGPFSRAW